LLFLSPWAPWESSPEEPFCSSRLPGAPDSCCCPLAPQPEEDPRGGHRVVGGEEAHPTQSATARPRPSASVLPDGEPCLSYRRITGNWSSWSGINHVPDVGFFLAFV
jgi:hypothetical protein